MAIELVIRAKDETGGALGKVSIDIAAVGSAAESSGGRLRGFLSGIKDVALGAAGLGAAAIGAAGAFGLSMNNAMEQASARIQAFTKDSAATAEILEMVKTRAAETPFAFQDMASAAANLLPASKAAGVGLEELIAQAEILAASNPAEGLEGAAFALKEAVSGDFTSVIERFNLPRQRLNELKEQGVPALEAVQIAMSELGLDADLVTGLAGTLEGRWSTFMDTMQGLAAQLTQPIFDRVSAGLAQVQSLLEANMPAIQAFTSALAADIGNAVATAGQWFSQLLDLVGPLVSAFQEQLPGATASGAGAFAALQGVVTTVMNGVQAVIGAVLPIVLGLWEQYGAQIMASVSTAWTTVQAIISTVAQIIGQVLQIIAGFYTEHGALITTIIGTAMTTMADIINAALSLISGIIQAVLQLIQGDFGGAWQTIQSAAGSFVVSLIGIIEGAASLLGSAVQLGIAAMQDAWDAFIRAAPGIGDSIIAGIADGINSAVGALVDAAASAAQAALDAAKDALGIESPSRVFAELVGRPIAQGMAMGMEAGMPMVANSATQMATAAVGASQAVMVGGSVGVNLSMAGDMGRYIDARIDERLNLKSQAASTRRLG